MQKSLAKHDGNISKAAADLGISRPTLYELIDKLGIKKIDGLYSMKAWKSLFPSISFVCCFLHVSIKILGLTNFHGVCGMR